MSWPALTWQEHTWTHRDPLASRRSQQRNVGTFRAAVVPKIARATIELPQETAQLAAASANRPPLLREPRPAVLPLNARNLIEIFTSNFLNRN